MAVRARVPQKQGLKHDDIPQALANTSEVRARVPQKQGLKRNSNKSHTSGHSVRARVPQKQGLKPISPTSIFFIFSRPGASSTKTRIETMFCYGCHEKRRNGPGASSTKTRIETGPVSVVEGYGPLSGREFHKNKD